MTRPAIRPGAPLLRRDSTHLQVGTSPGIVIDDRPGLCSLLRLLDGVRDIEQLRRLARVDAPDLEDDVAEVLQPLLACGAVVDATTLAGRRPRLQVALHAGAGGRQLGHTVRHVLTEAGLRTLDAPDPDLLIVISCGEPPRPVFEQAQRVGIPHVMVVLEEDRVRVGPLVAPGVTPCIACLDLHRTDWDHAWPVLVPQLGRSPWAVTPPNLSAPLLHVVAAEVGVEVLTLAEGVRPRTFGQVLALGPQHDARATWPVAFHHACSCALLPAA